MVKCLSSLLPLTFCKIVHVHMLHAWFYDMQTLASHLSELISQVMVHLLHMVSERGVYLAAESFDTLEENIR